MKLNGRRESTNVDDRRGMSAAKMGGLGIGGVIIALLMTFLSKGSLDLSDIVSNVGMMNVTEQAEGNLLPKNRNWLSFRSRFWQEQKMFGLRSSRNWVVPTSLPRWCSIQEACRQLAGMAKVAWARSIAQPTSACTSTFLSSLL